MYYENKHIKKATKISRYVVVCDYQYFASNQ